LLGRHTKKGDLTIALFYFIGPERLLAKREAAFRGLRLTKKSAAAVELGKTFQKQKGFPTSV